MQDLISKLFEYNVYFCYKPFGYSTTYKLQNVRTLSVNTATEFKPFRRLPRLWTCNPIVETQCTRAENTLSAQ